MSTFFKITTLNMDLPQLASEIQQLTQELNSWTSTFRLTLPSSESYLDLGCAVMGEESCTPIGSTDQPKKYPPGKNGSVYQFPNTYCGQESWSALYRIIQHSVSGCSILVHQAYPCRSLRRKATYHLCCQHGRKHEGISKVVMKDNCVGPSNVPHEHLKFVKKGTKSRGIVFFLHVFSVSIIIVKNNPCMRTIHLFLFAGTLGMATKKQQRAAAKKKKKLVKLPIAAKRKEMGRRTVSNRALDGQPTCPMKIIVFLANNNRWYLAKKSNLSHLQHPPLDSAAKLRSDKDLCESDRTLVSATLF